MKRSFFAIVFVFLAVPALAQSTTPANRKTATVLAVAPVYVIAPPTPNLGPLRTAAVGTVFLVIGEKEDWLQVEFNDPQYGRRVGWVEKKLVRVDDPALKPMDLSIQPPPPEPQRAQPAAGQSGATSPEIRKGFTVLVNLGLGSQYDTGFEESAGGLAGANFGVGGFVNRNLAVMCRLSGTNVNYGPGIFGVNQVSGVLAPSIQYWVSDRVTFETGAGLGFWATDFESDTGLGLIFAVNGLVFSHGRHAMQIGVEYAPAFTGSATVHNVGVTFGYQYHR